MRVTTTVKGNPALMRALQDIEPMQVLVGIPAGSDTRAATYPGSSTSNAQIGYVQEFGNPSTNLPPRPHLIPGVKDAMPRVLRLAQAALRAQTAGNAGALRNALDMFGLVAVASVRRRIQGNIPPPLAPRTRYNRLYRLGTYQNATPRRRASMRARWATRQLTPLIDTGAYIGAITYVVRRKP